MAVKGINPNSKCYVDVYTTQEVDDKFKNFNGVSSYQIGMNANLNNYTTAGLYKCITSAIATTVANKPVDSAFCLLVEEHAGIKQTFTRYTPYTPTVYVRNYYNGVWGSWIRQYNQNEDAQIFSGTATPASSLGKDGDVYFLY